MRAEGRGRNASPDMAASGQASFDAAQGVSTVLELESVLIQLQYFLLLGKSQTVQLCFAGVFVEHYFDS